ncbi:hypothetical protein, partial [Escherichia coli]|uniref:hypothetical protein n=1 Tax=Escherichia coli TaxID=562 RepID=UPI00202BB473
KSAQIREILISESTWEEMTCLFAPSLGTPVVITFNNTNSYQELNFKARMESPSKDATPGNVYAQADYKIAYE